MYYVAKLFQAAGLTIIVIDFIIKFPQLMNQRIFMLGILLFVSGWLINRYLLK